MNKVKGRIKWLDFAKGITIFFVVLYHVLVYSHFNEFLIRATSYVIGIFIMPLFFAISGYLYKSIHNLKDFKILCYKKSTSFLIPYIIFTLIIVYVQHPLSFLSILIRQNVLLFILPSGYLWFLYVLFCVFIIVGIMDLCNINIMIQFTISIIAILLNILIPSSIYFLQLKVDSLVGAPNPFKDILAYLLCFYVGRLLASDYCNEKLNNSKLRYMMLFSWILLIIFQYLLYGKYLDAYINMITEVLCIPTLLAFFIQYKHNMIFDFFDKYGKYTLIIYLIHLPILLLILSFIKRNNLDKLYFYNSYFSIFILFLITVSICEVVCYITNKFNFIKFIFYPRGYINKLIFKK